MNKRNFLKILQNPEKISQEEISFLEEINEDFPYFQVSKAIYLKSLKITDDLKFKENLRLTAAHSRDRKVLFDFINNIENQNEKIFFNKNEITSVLGDEKNSFSEITSEQNSFVEWLKISNLKPIDRSKESETIDKFISKKPKINLEEDEDEKLTVKEENDLISDSGYMTETLAKLYFNQKNYEKAIQSYKILILKFPEKSIYFANQIKKIKSLKK